MINFYKGYIDCAPTNASGNISHVAGKFSFKIHVAESHIFEELGWGEGAWITVTRGWDVVWDGWGRRYRTLKSTRGVVESIKKLTMKRGGGWGVWGAKFMKIKFGGGPAITWFLSQFR